tara:strand:- start:59 stop:724 length:666 start_codon:yes stop_codon:yes gene_type:complete
MEIIRSNPQKKKMELYPIRYTEKFLLDYNKIINDPKIKIQYDKWIGGINYITNRSIKINGPMYNKLKYNFTLENQSKGPNSQIITFSRHLLFDDEISRISIKEYVEETTKIYDPIDHINNDITEYNENIDKLIINIGKQKWCDYIEFEGIKYGIGPHYNNIHRENDCLGNIIEGRHEMCKCHACEDWNGCSSGGTQYYNCDKCKKEIYCNSSYSGYNYKGK